MYIQVDDLKMYYEEKGEGEPLLLLHGNSGSTKNFRFVYEELAKDWRVIAVDTRWHGKTKKGKKPAIYSQFCLDLKGFIDKKGLEKPNIIGYSDGGIIALEYAARFDNVGKIVTIGANWSTDSIDKDFMRYCNRVLKSHFLFRWIPGFNRRYCLHRIMIKGPYPERHLLEEIETDVMLMVGDRDIIPSWHTIWMNENINGSVLKIIEDCGHSIMKEQTQKFLEAVREFLLDEASNDQSKETKD